MKGKIVGAVAGGIAVAVLLSVYIFVFGSTGQHTVNTPVANKPVLSEEAERAREAYRSGEINKAVFQYLKDHEYSENETGLPVASVSLVMVDNKDCNNGQEIAWIDFRGNSSWTYHKSIINWLIGGFGRLHENTDGSQEIIGEGDFAGHTYAYVCSLTNDNKQLHAYPQPLSTFSNYMKEHDAEYGVLSGIRIG